MTLAAVSPTNNRPSFPIAAVGLSHKCVVPTTMHSGIVFLRYWPPAAGLGIYSVIVAYTAHPEESTAWRPLDV